MPKRRTRKRGKKYGGKAGKMHYEIPVNDKSNVLGAGSYGIVLANSNHAYKIFYNIRGCNDVIKEARIQQNAHNLLQGIVNVPSIKNIYKTHINYKGNEYLCGLQMERVPIPDGFEHPVHILLGYNQPDIDTVWSRDYKNPVSETNPARGFFSSPEMLEATWEDENITMTIDEVAYKMGLSYNILITNGILPYDVEWIYGGNGEIYLIDFGLCLEDTMSKKRFIEGGSSQSILIDYYVPKSGYRGYEAFLQGYNAPIESATPFTGS